jgi:hypothetical protein
MKRSKSKEKASGAVAESIASAAVGTAPRVEETRAASQPGGGSVIHLEFPPPEYLLEQARGESNRKLLQDYAETIGVLRDEKGFSFREIADWLTENGVQADYNSVYRVYTKGMSEMDVAILNRDTDEEEREG